MGKIAKTQKNQLLSSNEKMALAHNIMEQMELAGARDRDGFDVLMIVAHLLFPGQAVDLIIYNPVKSS